MKNRFVWIGVVIGLIGLAIWQYPSYCFSWLGSCYFVGEPIMRLSVSDEGRYVISSDNKGWITLWDIQQKTKKILDKQGSVYSADWVKRTPFFYWQSSKNNQIHVRDVEGGVIKDFNSGAPNFGSAFSPDLRHYIQGVSKGEGCYYYAMDLQSQESPYHPKNSDDYVICGYNPYQWMVLPDGRTLMSNAVVDMLKLDHGLDIGLKKLIRYDGIMGTVFGVISPDGKYVVGGQEGGRALVWHTETGKLAFELYDLYLGKLERSTGNWREDLLHVKLPEDFEYRTAIERGVISIKFIDKTHYLLFPERAYKSSNNDHAYAVLYDLLDPSPLKYLSLGKSPKPALQYFQRDQAIDTSWETHILVMAKENEGGILVYRYDPEKQTLKKIWDAK